ncbi:MAG: hypothetical protein FWF33_03235 [Clostridiales bacterium]|nr:hypothetical protein [Clostridiales bacterium]
MTEKSYERVNLLFTACRRGVTDRIIHDLRELGITYNMAMVGESRGAHGVLDYLGLDDEEFGLLFSVVSDSKVERALALIEYGYSEAADGDAIAALVPMEGVSGPLALEYISGPADKEE